MTKGWAFQIVLVLGIAGAAHAEEWSKRFTISGKPELRVDANDGAVVVRAWDHKEIGARVLTTGWRIPSDVQVVDRQMGDRVEIELKMPHHGFTFGITNRSIRIELDVPRDLRAAAMQVTGRIAPAEWLARSGCPNDHAIATIYLIIRFPLTIKPQLVSYVPGQE